MNLLLMLIACGSENLILDPDAECETSDIANGAITYELSCPDIPACPTVNLTCPELIVPACPAIEVTCPEPIVTVTAPTVTVNGPDMSGIEAAIDDMTIAMETAVAAGGSTTGDNFFAGVAYCTGTAIPTTLFTNNTSDVAIITSVMLHEEGGSIAIGGALLPNRFASVKYSHQNVYGHAESPAKHGRMTFPLAPGDSITCTTSSGGNQAFYQGYYR